ncbi:helix-turn-helix domain-containing protein [Tardiphaga sp. 804_B3_N1_9]|uniref:helix-turn-helix domain-containing protein n=1 Tax=Tardiphaga TaxID=1395974 RepID=UPI001585E536|nr:helix-turn-helix transcriptional regulator [Tardiphaga robiniae]
MYYPPKVLMAARQLLGVSREDLAEAAKIGVRTLASFEMDGPGTTLKTLEAVQMALVTQYGVQFLPEDEKQGFGIRFPRGHFGAPEKRHRPPRKANPKSKPKPSKS